MTTETTGSFPRGLQEGIRAVFGNRYESLPKEYTKLVEIETMTRNFEVDMQADPLGPAVRKPELNPVTYDSRQQSWVPQYQAFTLALGTAMSEEALDDILYPQLLKQTADLASSINEGIETEIASIFNRGFNSAYTMTGGDGVELFSTAHIRGATDTTTFSNELATPSALSEAALESLAIQIGNTRDARGNRRSFKPVSLHIPVDLMFEAARITKSLLQPDTADNNINAIKALSVFPGGVEVNHYFSSTTAYFIKTNVTNGVKMKMRRGLKLERDMKFETSGMAWKASTRIAHGWSDPRHFFASAGTS